MNEPSSSASHATLKIIHSNKVVCHSNNFKTRTRFNQLGIHHIITHLFIVSFYFSYQIKLTKSIKLWKKNPSYLGGESGSQIIGLDKKKIVKKLFLEYLNTYARASASVFVYYKNILQIIRVFWRWCNPFSTGTSSVVRIYCCCYWWQSDCAGANVKTKTAMTDDSLTTFLILFVVCCCCFCCYCICSARNDSFKQNLDPFHYIAVI